MSDVMQKDLVLAPNEYAFVLDETKGNVSCNVGPHKMSLSQSDKLVRFDDSSKKFVPCERYKDAIQLFVTAPEGWYVALKNPAPNNSHPKAGVSNTIPDGMMTGCKIMIPGPVNFALYPGQMAEIIQGHSLRSNQYLVAKVYDADALNGHKPGDEEPNPEKQKYVNGQTLIIKGTETSFYIPPTGIEVKAINNNPNKGYVRDAVTLERLEYCILKDEDGNKRYTHGPEVVFPSPTESFIQDGNGNIRRNAIELSDISGVYVKVISDYTDEDTGKEYKTGEELFITGKDQMIYYPRPEHTFITYNGRVLHHAVAIPKGEGRYVMNRMTGEIRTVRGPAMYLADPRTEVAVKRTLSRAQCDLWYPDNPEVLEANGHGGVSADDFTIETTNAITFADSTMRSPTKGAYLGTPTTTANNKINRQNTFTQPRTISLGSSKYEGAVAVDVWTGYAVNVISKDGSREVVCGPQTILLDYDQTLETLKLSTGKPKTTDNIQSAVFLRYENNHISDIVNVETKDFVKANIKVSYHVSFDQSMMYSWFSVDNYVKHLCDWCRSAIKKAAKEHTIAEFHEIYQDIVFDAINDSSDNEYLHKFSENGMYISDIETLSLVIEPSIQAIINEHQEKVVSRALELAAAESSAAVEQQIIALNREKVRLAEEYAQFKAEKEAETQLKELEFQALQQKAKNEEASRQATAAKALEELTSEVEAVKRENRRADYQLALENRQKTYDIDAKREAASAQAMKELLSAIGPDLAAAMNDTNNKDIVEAIAKSVSPYAIAEGESVSDAINKILRGTSMEKVVNSVLLN